MKETGFIVTEELGKLAKWLRVLGYDCVYHAGDRESDLVIQALRDRRVLLTRTERLRKYTGIKTVVIKHDHVEDQVEQVVLELGLPLDEDGFFQRCVECNEMLSGVEKSDIKGKVPEYVFDTQDGFKACPACKKVFWKGTHWDNVGRKVEEMREKLRKGTK
jgi:uncharacterized protein with PIN domain